MSKTNGERTFEDKPATREQTPLIIGLSGPSSSGKTYSALRLATGIQSVVGGDVYGIDTEAKRMLHYADRFRFRHVSFVAPFGPLDYLAAIKHCVGKGASTLIIDSMSHEHEGPGGVLEMHESEKQRMGGGDKQNFAAWAKPKADRRKLINGILQLPVNVIMCFRAKQKLKVISGKPPQELGWQPIAGEEFIYECALHCLMLPGARGTPSWASDNDAEQAAMKLPEQFESLFADAPQLSEDIGRRLAEWASGKDLPGSAGGADPLAGDVARLVAQFDAATSSDEIDAGRATASDLKSGAGRAWTRAHTDAIRAAIARAQQRLAAAEQAA